VEFQTHMFMPKHVHLERVTKYYWWSDNSL